MHVHRLMRYGSCPAVMLPVALMVLAVAGDTLPAWSTLAAVSAAGIARVTLRERLQPFEREWLPMPSGNTDGAQIGALQLRPISPALQAYLEEPAR